MKKRLRFVLIGICVLVVIGLRVFSPEDVRICDGEVLLKHGNPSVDDSGFFCSWGKLIQSFLATKDIPMKIISNFPDNGLMPAQYTCDGEGLFPRLTIEDIPANTKALALVVDDPDAPARTWDHLLLANIPVEWAYIVLSQESFDTSVFGQNSRGELARWAPCPLSWTHRYMFKVYALSENLDLTSWFSKERLLESMRWKINAQAQLVGLYQRK